MLHAFITLFLFEKMQLGWMDLFQDNSRRGQKLIFDPFLFFYSGSPEQM
jgi:hypothetical protein